MPSNAPRRIGLTVYLWRGLLLVGTLALLLAAFVFPAVLALQAGWSWPLALTVGLVAFPGLALAWHVVGELRRRGRPARAGSLRGIDRLALRTGVTCAAVLAGVVVGWGSDAWQALEQARARFGIGTQHIPLAGEPALAAFPPEIVALMPREATGLLAVPAPHAVLQRYDDGKLAGDYKRMMEECDLGLTELSVLGGVSEGDFAFVVHIPGFDRQGARCAVRVLDQQPWWDEFRTVEVLGGTRMIPNESKDDDKPGMALYVLEAGGIAVVSSGWIETFEARMAGRGKGVERGPLAVPLQYVSEHEADLWLVSTHPEADDGWVSSHWVGTLTDAVVELEGRILAQSEASAELVRDRLRDTLARWQQDMKEGGLDLSGALDIELKAQGDAVQVEAHVDVPALMMAGMLAGDGLAKLAEDEGWSL